MSRLGASTTRFADPPFTLLQDMMSSEQLQKLAELRKQRANAPQTSNNIVQVCQQAPSAAPQQLLSTGLAANGFVTSPGAYHMGSSRTTGCISPEACCTRGVAYLA